MPQPLPVILFGLGAIGRAVARVALERDDLRIIGAVDRDPALAGRLLGSLCRKRGASPRVVSELAALPRPRRRAVVIHATGSQFGAVLPQLQQAIAAGCSVVSSCEELVWPWLAHAAAARRLDQAARKAGVAVLGTGINPGFLLDLLPVVLSGVSRDVIHILGERVVDAASRRLPLQRKVGAGLSVAEFRARVRAGSLGHVGLPESAALIASARGWERVRIRNRDDPVAANRGRRAVAGLHQVVTAHHRRREVIRLDLTMALGAPDPHDRIVIAGTPPVVVRVEGGVAGDEATVAALIHGAFSVDGAAPGLRSALDVAPPRGRARPARVRTS
jgi:4-hydroxy-tetrahydrodipicolinate reductase